MYAQSLSWLLLAPFLLSLAAFAMRWTGKRSIWLAELIHLVSITAVLLLSMHVVQGVLAQGSISAFNDWLHVDALAAVFVTIVGVVGFLVGVYALGYIRHDLSSGVLQPQQVTLFYGLLNLFLFTMLLVVVSNNIIMMWVAVEATTLGSAFLVGIYGQRASLEAAWKYVIICTVGVAFGLYGTILVYSDAVHFMKEPGMAILWTQIVENAQALDPTILKLAFVFVMIGFGTKAGIFPMHAWLPDAHSEAPSPVSALLSGVLLKCALFVVIRFAIILSRGIGAEFPHLILLIFGALSVTVSTLFMFVQRDLKRLLAYSSVENIGLIVLALGVGGPLGVLAGLMHAVNHSLVKSLMFLTSGNILMKYHTRDLGKIHGMLQAAPLTSLLLLAGGLALAGSPPFNIFISKFSIFSAGMQSGHIWLMLVCLAFLAVAFAALLRVISSSLFGQAPDGMAAGEVQPLTLAPIAVLLVLAITLGLYLPPQIALLLNQAAGIALPPGSVASAPGALLNWLVLP